MIAVKLMTFASEEQRTIDLEDEMLVALFVPSRFQKDELGLYQSKWFDYQRMSPVQATCEYISIYGNVYRDIYAQEIDFERAKHVAVPTRTSLALELGKGSTRAKQTFSGLWRGRQVADAMGIPYDVYIERAFSYRMRRWQRVQMPRPQHLYHEYDVEKIQMHWNDLQGQTLRLPEDPAFKAAEYRGIPYQKRFREWLLSRASARHDRTCFINEMIERGFLPQSGSY